jgi:hypothetical protein
MSTDRASGLTGVQNNLPDNTQRLITEQIMRDELSKLWNSNANLIDDEFRFNLRDYQDRAYQEGEGCFFNGVTYRANQQVSGGAFDPAKWDQIGGSGVQSFNTRQGNVVSASGDYNSTQITNQSTLAQGQNVTEALDYLYNLATQGAINSFFVNSNNPNSGDGSISNPFNSLDLAYNTIVGNGTPANPELAPVGTEIGIVVQGGSYSTSQNLLIRRVSWVFELGAVVDYTGTNALFNMDASVFGNPSNELIEFFILGDGEFETSTGSFMTSSMGNFNGGGRLTLRGIRFTSNVINSNPDAFPVFNLDNNGNTAYQFGNSLVMPLEVNTIIRSETQTVFKLGNESANSGRKSCQISNAIVTMGSASNQGTQSLDARCVNIHRGHGVRFTDCVFTAYKNEYQVELSGFYRRITFDNCRFSTTSNSQGVKSVGAVRIQDGFTPNADGGGSSAVLLCSFENCSVTDNNFSSNELITFTGSGDLETVLLTNCFFSGGISSKIKIAKSISFVGNGLNPAPVVVTNFIDRKQTVSNLEENGALTRQVVADADGNLYFKTQTSGGGIVQSVVAGSNIEVNNTDPANPVVSAFPTTTAGVLSRTYFTGDTETLTAGTFYKSNRDGKGSVATVTQTVSVNDNQKAFFGQDLISDTFPIDTTIYAGSYTGVLNGLVSSGSGEQRFTVEIYKTDINGSPVASGITGQPVGDLGVQVIAIAQSGLIDLQQGNESQFSISAELTESLELLTTNRIRYHVSAEKVGTSGGAVTIQISYGFDHVAHLDVPVQATTDTVINLTPIAGATVGDVISYLDNNKLDRILQQNDGINGGGAYQLNLGNDATGENLTFHRLNSIQSIEQFSGVYPFVSDGVKVTKDPSVYRVDVKNGNFDGQMFLNSGQFSTTVRDNSSNLQATNINQSENSILLICQDSAQGKFGVINSTVDQILLTAQDTSNQSSLVQTPTEFIFDGELKLDSTSQNDSNTQILSRNAITNRVEWVDKSSIGGGGNKGIIKYEFVKSGTVSTQVTLESHSAFAGSTPIILPSGITSAKIVGFNFLSSTSVATQPTTATFEIRTQDRNNHTQRPFGGGVLRYSNTQLSVGSAQGTRYYESISDQNLSLNPITINVNDLVFVDLNPLFWQLVDVNVHVFIEVEI